MILELRPRSARGPTRFPDTLTSGHLWAPAGTQEESCPMPFFSDFLKIMGSQERHADRLTLGECQAFTERSAVRSCFRLPAVVDRGERQRDDVQG
jgi:hypothetical protein